MNKKDLGIEITNPSKIIYPKEKVTKIDVMKYYSEVAELMLPYVKNRLLSVIRCHQGIMGECFFKKHPTTESQNINIFKLQNEEYFYLKNIKDIPYQAQMGTIEFHIWGSNIKKIDKPDIMTFDLDPDEKLSLEKLRQGVKYLKETLDSLNLVSFLKTSGGKGYHILLPFSSSKNWEKFNEFAKNIALLMEQKWPDLYTSNIRKEDRKGKIFVDYLRNKKGATCVAPYSLRARAGANISFPIAWENLDKIAPNEIDIFNFKNYLNDNVWSDFFLIKQKIY